MQQITGEHMMMFLSQLKELMIDPYYINNFYLQVALDKLLSHLIAITSNMTITRTVRCPHLPVEMLILFLTVKSHFESVASCNQSTESQREEAKQAITEEYSESFARKVREYYDNAEWPALKSAPINIDDIVEIFHAIKTKYGNTWTLKSVAPSNPDRPKSGSGGSLLDLPPIKWR